MEKKQKKQKKQKKHKKHKNIEPETWDPVSHIIWLSLIVFPSFIPYETWTGYNVINAYSWKMKPPVMDQILKTFSHLGYLVAL